MENLYLIDSPNFDGLDKKEVLFIESCLDSYHNSSTTIDKVIAIDTLAANESLKGIQHEYNQWLLDFMLQLLKENNNKNCTSL